MGHAYRSFTYFDGNTCNTICDVTGFKVKLNETKKRWDGYFTIPQAWHPRQPQDFQITPQPQRTYPNSRFENENAVPLPPPFEPFGV